MNVETRALTAIKSYLEGSIIVDNTKEVFGLDIFLPNRSDQKTFPNLSLAVEDSEETPPGTGNYDIYAILELQSPMKGTNAKTLDEHDTMVEEIVATMSDNNAFKAFANVGVRSFGPFFAHWSQVPSAPPDPSKSRKLLISPISFRVVCIGVDVDS